MLKVQNLSFSYSKEKPLLSKINLKLEQGRILAIVGMSGSGKTSLLKLIYGLLAPDAGAVYWNNEKIPSPKDVLVPGFSKMKLVDQSYDLMPYIKVYENMQQHILHLMDEERKSILEEWLSFLNIKDIEHKKAKDLSGGQMQRVAIAKAFIANAELLLLDEPFSNLDTVTKSYLVSDLKEVIKKRDVSSIIVVHHPEDALEIADEIAVLNNGRIEQIGTPHEIYHQPKSKAVAELFGLTNYFTSAEVKTLLNINLTNFVSIENETVVRPHQLTLSAIKVPYTVLSELFLGYSTLSKVKAKDKVFWVKKE